MNIAYMVPNLHVTGGARVGVELGSRLVKNGHRFVIMVPAGRVRMSGCGGVEVIECGVRIDNPLLAVISGLVGMAFRLPQVDVIMASMPPHALMAAMLGKYRQVPAVNYLLNDDVHFFDDGSFLKSALLLRIYRMVARWSIRHTDVFSNSHWTAVRCVHEGGKRPAAIIPSGFDHTIFRPPSEKPKKKSECRIVTVGRHMKWKGFADLINALNMIDRTKYPFNLTVITQDNLDCSSAVFPVKVTKPGNDHELVRSYQDGDIFVHSSWFEGFGLPPLEAQACGLAVSATDSGGVKEFLKNEENALLVPPREPRRMADAVSRLIGDDELRKRLASEGLETSREFTWDSIAVRFEKVLYKLLDRS